MLKNALNGYTEAKAYLPSFLVTHLTLQLVVAAVVMPLASLLLGVWIAMSDQTALTDQDIARFLLTPAGALGAILVGSLLLVAAVLDVAVMTATLRSAEKSPLRALRVGAALVLAKIVPLLRFGAGFIVRVLLIVVPFAALAAIVAIRSMTEFDINYYLTFHPPGFLAAAGVIGALLLGAGVVLLVRLSGWAIALHLLLFRNIPAADCFAESARQLHGRRMDIVLRIIAWLVVRIVLGGIVAAGFGWAISAFPALLGSNLRLISGFLIVALLGWFLATALIAAWSNGALAVMLNAEFLATAGAQDTKVAPATPAVQPMPFSARWLVFLVPALVVIGFVSGGRVLSGISADDNVEIIAHRGAAGTRPENTMAAIFKAIEDGADWVEIDVQESAEGEIIVAHDSDFMKLAGVPLKVWDATRTDLDRIDIGSWFDPRYASERTPLLRDVLVAARGKSKVIIELKYYGHDVDLEAKVAGVVTQQGMDSDIAVMSLKYQGIQKMQANQPDWRSGILAAKAIGDLTGLQADFLALNTGQVSMRLIERAHESGKEVYVWTVNDPVTMSRMISMGVDGLITDEPALARRVLDDRNSMTTGERLALWLADRFDIGGYRLVADEWDA